MATYNKFEDFVLRLGEGVHELHAAGHNIFIYLTNNVPDAAADTIKAELLGITEENDYAPADITNLYTESGGTATLEGTDVQWTANGGTVGPFQYVVMYNDTPTSPADPLIAWWDYGSELTLNDGDSFTVDFGASIFTLA